MNAVRKMAKIVSLINGLELQMSKLSDQQLRAKTDEFRSIIKKNTQGLENQIKEIEARLKESTERQERQDTEVQLLKLKDELKKKTQDSLDKILPQAFAVVREAGKRTIGMRHFDVQLVGGIVLHKGKIAEMATGEGKTLVATLAAYLNALTGKGVHIVTVNDYLAKRDREWMGPIYEFLGLSLGVIQHDMDPSLRQQAYNCDITYGTNNEFGFDYLRDNMVIYKEEMVQREFNFAIVDEVDSILIDEARTPLIISGPAEESTEKYYSAQRIADQLKGRRISEQEQIDAKTKGEDLTVGFDYVVDERSQAISLTEQGEIKSAKLFGVDNLHEIQTMEYRHHIIQALRAKEFFKRDVDYVIKDNRVVIVDEFTGRLMPGRRWSDGLHQAVEAKENLKIARENQTLATITLQNYFRMYEKLSGMTGTAATEAGEFKQIYNLDVVVIPTNKPLIRTNYPDCVYKTEKEKFNAVAKEIEDLYNKGRPVLVGTISIEKSELLSDMLKRRGIAHQVLNAKYHELEAHIVAQAGKYKAVTIATNMAGRGTDILLGGNAEYLAKNLLRQKDLSVDSPEYAAELKSTLDRFKKQAQEEHDKVVKLGGLHIIGTERHEARRIDNQLRGRAGRQGDPGSSRFYVSLEDDLMRLFASDRIARFMEFFQWEEGMPIEHRSISWSIEIAQKRVESHNFEIRKQLLEYDNVMNKQRETIYNLRREVLEGLNQKEYILEMIYSRLDNIISRYLSTEMQDEYDWEGLLRYLKLKFNCQLKASVDELSALEQGEIKERIFQEVSENYQSKEEAIGSEAMRELERIVMLRTIDSKWKEHLYIMDSVKEGIGLRAYGHRDPLVEYQHEAFNAFQQMFDSIRETIAETIFRVQAMHEQRLARSFRRLPQEFIHKDFSSFARRSPAGEPQALPVSPPRKSSPTQSQKVGRNDPCPCGSGKKYKKCCGR
jgi:preprotein translocase subunit SecA